MRAQLLAIRMDMVEAEYKTKIMELGKRDLSTSSEQLKPDTEDISGKIEQWIQEIAQLLEIITS